MKVFGREYPKGHRFRVPTLAEMKSSSLWKQHEGSTFFRSEHAPGNCVTIEMLNDFGGKTLTVLSHPHGDGWHKVADESTFIWPVEAFEMMSSRVTTSTKTAPAHTCARGSTPLMGHWICKVCGKDLERWGL